MEQTPPALTADGRRRLHVLLHLAWPAIFEQVLNTMVSFVDTGMVSVLGPGATAAVGVNTPVIWLVNGIFSGIAVGYSVQVANAVGAKRPEHAKAVIRQSLLACLAVGLTIFTLFQILCGFIPLWMGVEPALYADTAAYLRYYTLGMPFLVGLFICSAVLRCTGDTKTPLILNTTTNVLNVVFNFFLIYPTREVVWGGLAFTMPGAGWGVAGAAAATAAAMTISSLLMLRTLFHRNRPLAISRDESYRPDPFIHREALHLGLPYIGERVSINLGQLFITRIVASIGTAAIAANHIAVTAEGLCYLPAFGISFAATTLTGQAAGARSREDARAYGILAARAGFALCTITGAALFLFAEPLARMFSDVPEVIDQAALVLRIVSVSEPFFAVAIILSGALRGVRDVRFPMVMALCCMWGVRGVLTPVLVYRFGAGLAGVWIAMALDLTARGCLSALRWKSGRWARRSFSDGAPLAEGAAVSEG